MTRPSTPNTFIPKQLPFNILGHIYQFCHQGYNLGKEQQRFRKEQREFRERQKQLKKHQSKLQKATKRLKDDKAAFENEKNSFHETMLYSFCINEKPLDVSMMGNEDQREFCPSSSEYTNHLSPTLSTPKHYDLITPSNHDDYKIIYDPLGILAEQKKHDGVVNNDVFVNAFCEEESPIIFSTLMSSNSIIENSPSQENVETESHLYTLNLNKSSKAYYYPWYSSFYNHLYELNRMNDCLVFENWSNVHLMSVTSQKKLYKNNLMLLKSISEMTRARLEDIVNREKYIEEYGAYVELKDKDVAEREKEIERTKRFFKKMINDTSVDESPIIFNPDNFKPLLTNINTSEDDRNRGYGNNQYDRDCNNNSDTNDAKGSLYNNVWYSLEYIRFCWSRLDFCHQLSTQEFRHSENIDYQKTLCQKVKIKTLNPHGKNDDDNHSSSLFNKEFTIVINNPNPLSITDNQMISDDYTLAHQLWNCNSDTSMVYALKGDYERGLIPALDSNLKVYIRVVTHNDDDNDVHGQYDGYGRNNDGYNGTGNHNNNGYTDHYGMESSYYSDVDQKQLFHRYVDGKWVQIHGPGMIIPSFQNQQPFTLVSFCDDYDICYGPEHYNDQCDCGGAWEENKGDRANYAQVGLECKYQTRSKKMYHLAHGGSVIGKTITRNGLEIKWKQPSDVDYYDIE